MGIGGRIGNFFNETTVDKKVTENNNVIKNQKKIEFYPVEPRYSFDDIILPENVKEEILNVAEYQQNSKLVFEDWNLQSV